MLNNVTKKTVLIVLSFAAIYIIWGSTYLFAAFALEQLSAFGTCAMRYTTAAAIIFLLLPITGGYKRPSRLQLKNSIIAGFMFIGLGTGGAIWALNYIDTGFTALIIAGEPLIVVMMLWVVNRRAPSPKVFVGIALGIIGIYLLVSQRQLIYEPSQWIGLLVIVLSMLAWGAGSIFVNKSELPESQFLNSGIQMLVGGLVTALISLIIREENIFAVQWTFKTMFSLAFLIVFGSIVAFTAFNFLLRNVSTEKVVTNTYVNPIIAMILGYIFRDELITWQSVIAAVVMLVGVFIINTNKT